MKYTILLTVVILGCNYNNTVTFKNETIDKDLREDIRNLDSKVLKALKDKDINLLKSISSPVFNKNDSINVENLRLENLISSFDHNILDQYHLKGSTPGAYSSLTSGDSLLNGYNLKYRVFCKEAFLSLFTVKNMNNSELLVLTVYGKYNDEWKLDRVQIGNYKVDGKTAPELYLIAEDDFQNGFIIDAANSIFLSSYISRPLGNSWEFQNVKLMSTLQRQIGDSIAANYSFPITLYTISSKPEIIKIYPQITNEGYFPMIEYRSKINLNDTIRTRIENEEVNSSIGQVFRGLDKNKKYIFYTVYNRIPDGINPVPTYGFVQVQR